MDNVNTDFCYSADSDQISLRKVEMFNILSIFLRVCSIILTISATVLWGSTLIAAEKEKRAVSFKNVQTLIAGTLWSQILIPVGLLISELASERVDTYVEGYFLLSGACLLLLMGIFIVSFFLYLSYL